MPDPRHRSGEHHYHQEAELTEKISTTRIENAAEAAAESALEAALPKALQTINEKLDVIIKRLAEGDTAIALLRHRVFFLEKIVYGGCALMGVTVFGAIIALVVHH